MKQITIDGKTLTYQTMWDCDEGGTWCWTEFYNGTKTEKYRKFGIFGKMLEREVPNKIFTIPADSMDLNLTKQWWKDCIKEKLELLDRAEQLKMGELV